MVRKISENLRRKKIASCVTNSCPGNLKPKRSLRVFFSSSVFFSEAAPKIILRSKCSKISRNSVENTCGRCLFQLQDIGIHIYRNRIAQHVVLGILKQLFLGIPAIGCCTQKQLPEVYKKAVLKISHYSQESPCVGVSL